MECNNIYDRIASISREVYIEIDNNNLISYISENCFNLSGYTQNELLSKNIKIILYFDTLKTNNLTNITTSLTKKNNSIIPVDLSYSSITDSNNNHVGFKISLIDISAYIKFESDKQTIIEMFERSKDIIYRAELIPSFRFTYISPAIYEILGYTAEEHLIDPTIPFKIAHPDDHEILIGKITDNIDFSRPLPVRYKHRDGHYVWLDDYCLPIYDENGVLITLEGFSRDITDKKLLEEKLKKLSYYDGLTAAYNKFYLEKEIDILNTKNDTSVGIVFCDLDNLKVTNDTLGHTYGDKLIINTFNILEDVFTKNSIISRTGGDEFIIIIKDTSLNELKDLYLLLCNSIEHQNKYNLEEKVKMSIGYSFSETSIDAIRDLINIADKNMYKDKQRKKLIIQKDNH